MIPIYVGYDPREPIAYHVCCNSIIRTASKPVCFIPLALGLLDDLYQEEHRDGSNDFIYSRFLVPYLNGFQGHAIYLDGDMLVKGDIVDLWNQKCASTALQCVKHDYQTKAPVKYLGQKNEDYPKKNWSSVILWNCGHPTHRNLVPDTVSKMTGKQLHRFLWMNEAQIGALSPSWNWLETENPPNPKANLVHYTLGTPCFDEYSETETAWQWKNELSRSLHPIKI